MKRTGIAMATLMAGTSLLGSGAAFAQSQGSGNNEAAAIAAGDIIVTAQRREERLRDVPISIVAKSGDQLARSGITAVDQIAQIVPGVKIDQIGNYLQPAIRGVSSTLSGPHAEAPVAMYVDGVVQPNQNANFVDFVDLERIEVAKGPQGTLFGRNATGGAIAIFTKQPSYTPTGSFSVGYGNYNDFVAKGYLSGPLIENVAALSLSGYYQRRDSFDYNIATNQRPRGLRSTLLRAKMLIEPAEGVKFTLIGQYQDRFNSDAGTGIALARNTPASQDPAAIIATRPYTLSVDYPNYLDVQATTGTLIGEFDIGGAGTLKSITGYGDIKVHITYDSDRAVTVPYYNGVKFDSPEKYFTQEVSFASNPIGPFSFVTGLYYIHRDNKFVNLKVEGAGRPATDFTFNSGNPAEAWAAFAEGNLKVSDRLTAIAGIRYSDEKRSNSGDFIFGPGDPTGFGIDGGTVKFRSWTPRFSLKYDVTSSTNVYFTYSKGFKSGGLQNTSFIGVAFGGQPATFRPEKITAYEVGLKSQPTRNLSFNLAGYYYKYSDLQVQVQLNIGSGTILNAASARIYGIDADAVWQPIDGLSLTAGLSVLDAKYENFANAQVQRPLPAVPGIGLVGNGPAVINASGNWMTRAPKYSASIVADYKKETSAGTIGANLSFSASGTVYYDSDNRLQQSPYGLLNGLVSWQLPNSGLRFEVWGKNLTNKAYISSVLVTELDAVGYAPPRTFGGTVSYRF